MTNHGIGVASERTQIIQYDSLLMNHTNESFIMTLVKLALFSSSIPFLIAKDLITRLSFMSTIVATRIFAKVGMQSYSIRVFVSGDKYSETGLSVVCRDRILGRFSEKIQN